MTTFEKFDKIENKIHKKVQIDEKLYKKLIYLVNNVYDTSINKLVNAAMESLVKNKNIILYAPNYDVDYQGRSFIFKESIYKGIFELSKKYAIPKYKLINLAISQAIEEYEKNIN